MFVGVVLGPERIACAERHAFAVGHDPDGFRVGVGQGPVQALVLGRPNSEVQRVVARRGCKGAPFRIGPAPAGFKVCRSDGFSRVHGRHDSDGGLTRRRGVDLHRRRIEGKDSAAGFQHQRFGQSWRGRQHQGYHPA